MHILSTAASPLDAGKPAFGLALAARVRLDNTVPTTLPILF